MAEAVGGDLLDEEQTAKDFFSGLVSVRTLQKWRQLKKGPPFCKIGHHIFYRRADLVAYVERSLVETETVPALERK